MPDVAPNTRGSGFGCFAPRRLEANPEPHNNIGAPETGTPMRKPTDAEERSGADAVLDQTPSYSCRTRTDITFGSFASAACACGEIMLSTLMIVIATLSAARRPHVISAMLIA